MRKHFKEQCFETIQGLEELHLEIEKRITSGSFAQVAELLELCQQAAIGIGNLIESSEGEGTEAVSQLEKYCDYTYTS